MNFQFSKICILLALLGLGAPTGFAQTARSLFESNDVVVAAHRGNSAEAPELTKPAFDSAVALGIDMLEIDYQPAKDGLVVVHDQDSDRTSNVKNRKIADMTVNEIKQTMDVGSWFGSEYGGERVYTLEEALKSYAENTVILLEKKTPDSQSPESARAEAKYIGEYLRKNNLLNRVIVFSFDWEFLKELRKVVPAELIIGALEIEQIPQKDMVKLKKAGIDFVSISSETVSRKFVHDAGRLGLSTFVWPDNREAKPVSDQAEHVSKLIDMGVKGVITNKPRAILPEVWYRNYGFDMRGCL